MMFCENCGAKVADGDAFCQSCGKKIVIPSASQEKQPGAQPAAQQAQTSPYAQQQNAKPNVQQNAQPTAQQAQTSPYAQQQNAKPNVQQNVQPTAQQTQASPYAQQQSTQPGVQQNARPTAQQTQANPYAQNPYGGVPAPRPQKPPFKLTKKMIIIGAAALAALVAIIVVICVVVFVINSPVNKMISAINSGDYETANEIYYKNHDELYGNESVIQAIQDKIDAVLSDYKNGTIDYGEALDKLSDISTELPMTGKTTLSKVRSEIYGTKEAEDNLETGDKYLGEGEYSNAIYYYDLISEDYSDTYSKAQEQRTKAIDGLRQQYLDYAEEYIADGSYGNAIDYLNGKLDEEYFEGDKEITAQISTYVDSAISKSDEYFSSGEYSDAADLISGIMSCFSESDDNYTKLNTQLEKLEKETPVFLSDMDYSDTDNFYRYQGGSKDVTGISYDGDNVCTMSVSKYYDTATVEMYVKDYKKIKGTLAVESGWSGSPDSKAYLEVLDGSKVLYKSETFNGKSKAVDYEVNITDVEWLTIKLTFVKDSGTDSFSLILADNVLYKIGSSEPDAAEVSAEESKAESSKAESSKAESSKAETSKTESSESETTSKTESSKTESSKAESSKAA